MRELYKAIKEHADRDARILYTYFKGRSKIPDKRSCNAEQVRQ